MEATIGKIAAGQNAGATFSRSCIEDLQAEGAGTAYTSKNDPVTLAVADELPPWYAARRQQIIDLEHLSPNWDSYGAPSINKRSIVLAQMLYEKLSRFVGVEEPTVTASPTGNVAFCWDNGKRSLDVEVLDDGTFAFVFLDGTDDSKDEDRTTEDADYLLCLLTSWQS